MRYRITRRPAPRFSRQARWAPTFCPPRGCAIRSHAGRASTRPHRAPPVGGAVEDAIRAAHAAGKGQLAIARDLGVGVSTGTRPTQTHAGCLALGLALARSKPCRQVGVAVGHRIAHPLKRMAKGSQPGSLPGRPRKQPPRSSSAHQAQAPTSGMVRSHAGTAGCQSVPEPAHPTARYDGCA